MMPDSLVVNVRRGTSHGICPRGTMSAAKGPCVEVLNARATP